MNDSHWVNGNIIGIDIASLLKTYKSEPSRFRACLHNLNEILSASVDRDPATKFSRIGSHKGVLVARFTSLPETAEYVNQEGLARLVFDRCDEIDAAAIIEGSGELNQSLSIVYLKGPDQGIGEILEEINHVFVQFERQINVLISNIALFEKYTSYGYRPFKVVGENKEFGAILSMRFGPGNSLEENEALRDACLLEHIRGSDSLKREVVISRNLLDVFGTLDKGRVYPLFLKEGSNNSASLCLVHGLSADCAAYAKGTFDFPAVLLVGDENGICVSLLNDLANRADKKLLLLYLDDEELNIYSPAVALQYMNTRNAGFSLSKDNNLLESTLIDVNGSNQYSKTFLREVGDQKLINSATFAVNDDSSVILFPVETLMNGDREGYLDAYLYVSE